MARKVSRAGDSPGASHHRREDADAHWPDHVRLPQHWTNKQAAEARAKALASIIRALQAKGLVSFGAIARALNEGEIPGARGGKWHPSSVDRLMRRLERLERSSRTVVAPTSDAEPK
jgi:hypothetical protein